MDIRRGTDGWILEDAVGVKFFCIESVYERTRVEILLPPETSARQFAESFVSTQRGTALRRSGLSYVVDSSPRKHTVSLRRQLRESKMKIAQLRQSFWRPFAEVLVNGANTGIGLETA